MFVLFAFLFATSCSVLSSNNPNNAGTGTSYKLPKALITAILTENVGTFTVDLSEPRYFGDDDAEYIIHYRASPFSSDTWKIEVNPQTRLMVKIESKAEDKTDDIIVKIAQTVAMFLESATERGGTVVYSRDIDPAHDDPKQVAKELNDTMYGYAKRKRKELDCPIDRTQKPQQVSEVTKLCTAYANAADEKERRIEFGIDRPALTARPPADCSVGVCYRVPVSYTFHASFNNSPASQAQIQLPNGADPVALDISRAFMVTKVTNIDFVNGAPSTVYTEKPSEALDFVSLPVQIAKALISVPTELLQLKIDRSDKELGLAEKEKARIEAERALKETKRQEATPPQARPFILSVSNGAIERGGVQQVRAPQPNPDGDRPMIAPPGP